MRWKNIFALMTKEFRSLFSDPVLLLLMLFMFSAGIINVAKGSSTEVKNASVAVLDHDQSALSYRLRSSLLAPNFKHVVEIRDDQVDSKMDDGSYTFVIDIPSNFERDWLRGENPNIQLLVDATAMTQAGNGASYIGQIFNREVANFFKQSPQASAITSIIHVAYNPNFNNFWLMGTMQIVSNLNLLTLILVGSAVIRERERGTIEHLLVMPVSAAEIALAKILANGLVIMCAALLSLWLIVRGVLGVPIMLQSIPLFATGIIVFLFSMASLGILLAILAPTMPQFGLLCIPVYILLHMLSGTMSPLDNMPELTQTITQVSPVTLLASFAQDVLFRHAGLDLVWSKLLQMGLIGAVFLGIALKQFKTMLSKQG